MSDESVIKFPCEFTIKVMGKTDSDFENAVIDIISQHDPDFNQPYQKRLSKDENYLALTFKIHAQSKAQLDQIYTAINQCEGVVMVL